MRKFIVFINFLFCISSVYSQNISEINGNITENTVWTSDTVYIITGGDLYIDAGATLTIAAGTIVKFEYVNPPSSGEWPISDPYM